MALDYDDAYKRSRDVPAFSNGTEGCAWMANWCDRCLRDAPFRNGISQTGCPLILIAEQGRTPAEWFEQPWGQRGSYDCNRYHCIEYRAPGGGGDEPQPIPTPPDQGALFDRPPSRPRMLTPLPDDLGAPVQTVTVAGGLL